MASVVFDVVKKIVMLGIALLIIATADFVLFQASHDGELLVPRTNDVEFRSRIIEERNLDESLGVQYIDFLAGTFTGDFYTSTAVYKNMPIESIIWNHSRNTVFLFGSITLLSIVAASALTGFWVHAKSWTSRKGVIGLSILASSAFSGAIPLIVLSVNSALGGPLPMGGPWSFFWPEMNSTEKVVDLAEHAIIPIISGVLMTFGLYSFVFITGIQKLKERRDLQRSSRRQGGFWRALGLESPFTLYLASSAMTSTILVDITCNYRGLGTFFWEGLIMRDFAVVMASFFVISLMVAIVAFVLDLAIIIFGGNRDAPALTNPQTRYPDGVNPPRSLDRVLSEAGVLYRKSLSGMIALIILIIMVVAAVAAPLISTVENPNRVSNYEPNVPSAGWINPLPPSLDRSPYTGFIHPLGTDYVGQDIYSLAVYGLRTSLLIMSVIFAFVVALGFLVGLVSSAMRSVRGLPDKAGKAILTAGSFGMLSMPLLVIMVGLWAALYLDLWGSVILFCVIYMMWSWSAISGVARPRAKLEPAATSVTGKEQVEWHRVVASVLHVTKYAVILGFMTVMMMDFIGIGDPRIISWGEMLESAYERNVFIDGPWAWILSPFIAALLTMSASFVAVHVLEKSIEKAGARPSDVPARSA